ncbi:MAG: hypothetical protein WD072_08250, partial [Pirellulales bacterium]
LAVGVDTPAKSSIATAMMNLVSGYSDWAFERYQDAAGSVATMTDFKRTDAYRYLSPVGRNTFVYLKAPSPNEVATLKDLGIFGNTNDGVLQYIEPPAVGTMKQLDDQVRALPLYYSQSERVSAVQSVPPAARLVVTTLAKSGPGSLRRAIHEANAAGRYRQITFAVAGTIRLASALPLIRVPVSIDGRAAVANPYAPRFATDPRVAINFNGRAGLQFAEGATGSQVSAWHSEVPAGSRSRASPATSRSPAIASARISPGRAAPTASARSAASRARPWSRRLSRRW